MTTVYNNVIDDKDAPLLLFFLSILEGYGGREAVTFPFLDYLFVSSYIYTGSIELITFTVIVKDNRQIATGYNGTPPGVKNCYEGGCLRCLARTKGEVKSGEGLDRCLCTHAEANAIMQCALFGNAGSTKGAMLYSTFAPCLECSKMAISVGIKRIVVLADYPEDGTQLLRDAKVELVKLNPDLLKPWLSVITADPESSAKAVSK